MKCRKEEYRTKFYLMLGNFGEEVLEMSRDHFLQKSRSEVEKGSYPKHKFHNTKVAFHAELMRLHACKCDECHKEYVIEQTLEFFK